MIKYHKTDRRYDSKVFVDNKLSGQLGVSVLEADKHIYDYVKTASDVELKFAKELEKENEVIVYAKLANGLGFQHRSVAIILTGLL